MNTEQATENVERLIAERDHVTFVEIRDELKKLGVETEGDLAVHPTDKPNLILWHNMSRAFCDVFHNLMSRGNVSMQPAAALSYIVDGALPTLPVAKSFLAFAKPHWLPVCFRPTEATS